MFPLALSLPEASGRAFSICLRILTPIINKHHEGDEDDYNKGIVKDGDGKVRSI